jgi:hypothetical protein
VHRRSGPDVYATEFRSFARGDSNRVAVSLFPQPFGYHWRSEKWYVILKCVERIKRQVIGMRMCQQDRIEFRKRFQSDAGWAHARQESPECRIEIGVSEDPSSANFN